jgi:hypothetical protein
VGENPRSALLLNLAALKILTFAKAETCQMSISAFLKNGRPNILWLFVERAICQEEKGPTLLSDPLGPGESLGSNRSPPLRASHLSHVTRLLDTRIAEG